MLTISSQEYVASLPSVVPSRVDPANSSPFTLDQDLVPFGRWTSKSIWVPPKDASSDLATTMLQKCGPLADREVRWSQVIETHRRQFTEVREFELRAASIRLPKGRIYVSVTQREQFDEIEDQIPACVQTRLDEFLEGKGKRRGVRVYYLKPLCVEIGEQLIFTERADIEEAIQEIQSDVFQEYRRRYLGFYARQFGAAVAGTALWAPRKLIQHAIDRKKRALDAYQAQLEYNRRKTAFRAAKVHRRLRTDGCTFDQMLELTNPLDRQDVVEQYAAEHELSRAERDRLLRITAASVPWFVALALGITYLTSVTVTAAPPVALCDPAFVAEMPERPGVLLKIGHFDEIGGVTHVEL